MFMENSKPFFRIKNFFFALLILIFISNSLLKAEETLFIMPSEINFGETTVGIEKKIKILITNVRNEPIQIQEVKLSNNINFWINENGGEHPCGLNRILNFKEKCTMEVIFLPFEEKKYNEEIKFYTSDDKKTKIKLYGKGVQVYNPQIEVHYENNNNNNMYDFGYIFIGDTFPKMFTIQNKGEGILVFRKKIRVSDDKHFEIDINGGTNPCNSLQPILGKEEFCTFMVYFKPDKEKKYETKLKLDTNDPENKKMYIKLYGKGTANPIPKIEIEKVRENFVDTQIGTESNLMIFIKNKGNGTLEIVKMELSNDKFFNIDVNAGIKPCNSYTPSVLPGEFCTIYVKFRPEKNKTYKSSLTIISNDKKVKISLKGKGKYNISETSNSETLAGNNAGCSFGLPTMQIYLLILIFFFIRKIKLKN